jgi:hypothetical protein
MPRGGRAATPALVVADDEDGTGLEWSRHIARHCVDGVIEHPPVLALARRLESADGARHVTRDAEPDARLGDDRHDRQAATGGLGQLDGVGQRGVGRR